MCRLFYDTISHLVYLIMILQFEQSQNQVFDSYSPLNLESLAGVGSKVQLYFLMIFFLAVSIINLDPLIIFTINLECITFFCLLVRMNVTILSNSCQVQE